MRLQAFGGVTLALLLSFGCGGGGVRNSDTAPDMAVRDVGRFDSLGVVEPSGVDTGGASEAASGHDAVPAAGEAGDIGQLGGIDAGGPDLLDGAPDSAAQDSTTVDGGAPLDPCDPAAITVLALAGEGTVTEAGLFSLGSRLQPRTVGCTEGTTGPEVVYALGIPEGVFHLEASTVSGAATTADTVLYVQTACGGGQELACNDDAEIPGPSRVSTRVTGPGTVYVVVDSFAPSPGPLANTFSLKVSLSAPAPGGADCAPVQPGALDPCTEGFVCPPVGGVRAACTVPTPPVIDAAELFPQPGQPATETTLFLSAHDGQGDWRSMHLVFKDAGGAVLDAQDLDLSEYWGEEALAAYPFALSVPPTTASVNATVTDSASLSSATLNAALTPWGSLGQSCNAVLAAPDPCLSDLVCTNATCVASAAATSACAQATTLTLGSPVPGTVAALVSDTFEGGCVSDRGGNDKVLRVTLPALAGNAVAWDLVATTENDSLPWDYDGQLDTYVYIRANCIDPATELGCNDDLADNDLRSESIAKNLVPGSYFLFLDTSSPLQNGTTAAYTLLARARPVLPSGAVCAANGVANRCQAGTCSALTGLCP
jgi:hypothetical protein